MTLLGFAAALTAQATPPPSGPVPRPDWQIVSRAPDMTVYLERDAARRTGDIVRVPIHSILTSPPAEDLADLASISFLVDFDCRQQTMTLIEGHAFGPDGVHLEGGPMPVNLNQPQSVRPGSEDAAAARLACAMRPAAQ